MFKEFQQEMYDKLKRIKKAVLEDEILFYHTAPTEPVRQYYYRFYIHNVSRLNAVAYLIYQNLHVMPKSVDYYKMKLTYSGVNNDTYFSSLFLHKRIYSVSLTKSKNRTYYLVIK